MRQCCFLLVCLPWPLAIAANAGQGQPPLLDLHGDPLPTGATARLGTVRWRHDEHIGFAAFVPDGKSVVSVGFDQTIRVWEFPSGKEIRRIELATATDPQVSPRQTAILDAVALSKDGKIIATCFSDLVNAPVKAGKGPNGAPKKKIRLHEVATGKELPALEGEADSINALAFSPDGQHLTSFDVTGIIRIWDWANAKQIRTVTRVGGGRQNFVVDDDALVYAPDGKTLLYVQANSLRFIDVPTGKDVAANMGHSVPLVSVQFTPNGRHLLTQSTDGVAHRWDAATSEDLGAIKLAMPSMTIAAVSPDGQLLVGVPGSGPFPGGFGAPLAVKAVTGDAILFDAAGEKQLGKIALDSFKGANGQAIMRFSPDGKMLAICNVRDQRIALYDIPSGKLLHNLEAVAGLGNLPGLKGGPINAGANPPMLFSSDAKVVAFYPGAGSNTVTMWDTATGKKLGTLMVSGSNQFSLGAFSPDGRCLAIDIPDGTVRLYELATGSARRTFGNKPPAPGKAVPGVAVGPAAFGGGVPGGFVGGGFPGSPTGQPQASPRVAISPDGKSLVQAGNDRIVHLWDVLTGQELAAFKGHSGPLLAVAFAPNGQSIASASADTTALLWDATKVSRPALTAKTLESGGLDSCWQALANADAAKGFVAICDLAAAAKEAVPFIEQQLKPATPLDMKRIEVLIGQLDDKVYKVREKATSELLKVGEQIVPELEKVLTKGPTLEARTRLEDLRNKLAEPILKGERLRAVRAVEVLERIGTPEARQVLQALAEGAPGALITVSAQAALKR